jgi:gamma-glutamylcyclotransferase (GGCT)/AIG2-like uncharacterized protein YtfP
MSNSDPSSESDYLFVYGTLRRSLSPSKDLRHLLHHETEFLGSATVPGRLYNIGNYPGLILSDDPEEVVTGELYKIKNKRMVLSALDRYEGCIDPYPRPWEYERITAEVRTETGSTLISWLYTYQWDVPESMRIQSGDYLTFLTKK